MTKMNSAPQKIKVFLCDSDGVLFPNTVVMGSSEKSKPRSYYDGQGISLLRALGIRVAFITNEQGAAAAALRETVEKCNSLPSSQPQSASGWKPVALFEGYGGIRKVEAAEQFLAECGASFEEVAFMGDDLVDVPLLEKVALAAAPSSAEEAVKALCAFVSERPGGNGAIRDFANMILEVRQVDPRSLPTS